MTSSAMHPRATAVVEYWYVQEAVHNAPSTPSRNCLHAFHPPRVGLPCTDTNPKSFVNDSSRWFRGGDAVDAEIKTQFARDVEIIRQSTDYDDWLHNTDAPVQQAVAGIILLDQFSRNMYRGTSEMYALDPKALSWSKTLLVSGVGDVLQWDTCFYTQADGRAQQARIGDRVWILMTLMHSEAVEDQEACVAGFASLRDDAVAAGLDAAPFDNFWNYAKMHLNVVQQWGRFPHRNAILGRASTAEEEVGLREGTIPAF